MGSGWLKEKKTNKHWHNQANEHPQNNFMIIRILFKYK